MASLIVTFSTAYPTPNRAGSPIPVPVGSKCRTVLLDLASTSGDPDPTPPAEAGETVVELYAEAACWYIVGPGTPVPAVGGAGCRFLAEGASKELWVEPGDAVAAVAAV